MKKITLLIALAVATMATAQTLVQNEKAMEVKKATFSAIEVEGDVTMVPFSAETYAQKAVTEGEYAAADYYYVEGMLHLGLSPEFMGVGGNIMLPYQDSMVWNSYYGPTDWYQSADNSLLAEKSETYTAYAWQDYGIMGGYYLPYTTDHTFNLNGTDYLIKGYTYSEAAGIGGAAYYVGYTPISVQGYNMPLTLCGMETSTLYEESGSDFYQVGTKNTRGLYLHGTGLYYDVDKTQRIDTMGQVVRNVSTLKIDEVYIPVYNQSGKEIAAMFPEGASVKIEIFNADLTTGVIDLSEPVASTVVTAADVVEVQPGIGTIVAKFYVEDILGGLTEAPVYVEGDFYLQITNYNETGCEFGIFSDYWTPAASTYYTKDGQIFSMNINNGSHNMAIGYFGYWPALVPDALTDEVTAPVEGGVAYYGEDVEDVNVILITNVMDIDAFAFDAPEWVSFEPQLVNLSSTGTIPGLVFQVTAEALTEGTGRQGVITVEADGAVYELVVKQGDVVGTSVDNVVAPMHDNKIYNLLGVEVDENYKGIVIKNGQKFIQ